MIVLMAGLPGTGKSTLCRRLSGSVLDKDEVRAALFPPSDIEYSTEQDDFCMKVMLETAEYILKKDPLRFVFLDGRPFSRRYQIDQAIAVANELNQPWRILECICSEETARRRLDEQIGTHPAGNRDFEMYLRVKAGFEEIAFPKTIIDTEQSVEACVSLARAALR
jgi:predicted kinase